MSALGEYVHYKKSNYERYGIARKNNTAILFEDNNIVNTQIDNLPSVSKKTIEEIKKRLLENSDIAEQRELSDVEMQAQKRLKTIFDMLKATSSKEALSSYFYAGVANGANTKSWLPNDIKNVSKGGLKGSDAAKKRADLKKIEQKLNNINGSMVTEADLVEILQLYNSITGSRRTSTNSIKSKSALVAVKEELNDYAFNTVEQHVAGKFGELLVSSIGDTAYNLSGKALKEALKKASSSAVKITEFAIDKSMVSSYADTDENGSLYDLHSTYDKVDAEITINGEQIEASVKNYRTAQPVHLQRQSLIYALIKLNDNGFGTHWMNMHALNVKNSEADKTLEKEIAYDALVYGNPLKKGVTPANTFIYINRNTGAVEVYNTKDLLKTLEKISISPSIKDIILQNRFTTGGTAERISSLINQVHQKKIEVTFIPKGI